MANKDGSAYEKKQARTLAEDHSVGVRHWPPVYACPRCPSVKVSKS